MAEIETILPLTLPLTISHLCVKNEFLYQIRINAKSTCVHASGMG